MKEDPRYKQCNKEALICVSLGLANLIWWFSWGYGLGSKDPSEYTFVMGFPLWFFMSCIVGALLFTVLTVVLVNKYFVDFSLEETVPEEFVVEDNSSDEESDDVG
ncbi:YhdT family protein [Natranaerofaba carboxydovora]|uniref:YhdT family protein n=1 Tax=Natranaerofaba carboxydovora TaxID=2742683 RepID=UPI001F13D6F1|nr:YhdT family protein [Natranaerofaba carboxydovora]UMZ73627.1 hypothetical protein ACONDI_01190 [Natranaerofaba carboxydovora]